MSKSLEEVLAEVDLWKAAVAKEMAGLTPAQQLERYKQAGAWFRAEMEKLAKPKRKRKPARKRTVRAR